LETSVTNDENLTVKQQREKRRAEKVAALKAKQKKEKRRRIVAVTLSSVAVVAVVGIVIGVVVSNATRPAPQIPLTAAERAAIEIDGEEVIAGLEPIHTTEPVQYDVMPPAGGPHNPSWLNCGVYEEEQPAEYAVHSLEHGAIWLAYDPEQISDEQLTELRRIAPDRHAIVSPIAGLESPVIASAWGARLQVDDPSDERVQQFIDKYWLSPSAPEPGALCSNALDGPGRVS
jgi:hypothetical protein